jgi:ubiquinone/menaquinone biosynthesis C-methylase UbiE
LKGKQNKILDLACGAGRDYFSHYGEVVGIDLIKGPLLIAKKYYQEVIQTGINALPFPDNYFDYVVSSDIFGHIRLEDKMKLLRKF